MNKAKGYKNNKRKYYHNGLFRGCPFKGSRLMYRIMPIWLCLIWLKKTML